MPRKFHASSVLPSDIPSRPLVIPSGARNLGPASPPRTPATPTSQPSSRASGPASPETQHPIAIIQRVMNFPFLLPRPLRRSGQLAARSAQLHHRTSHTCWRPRHTHRRTQFHHCLIKIPRPLASSFSCSRSPKLRTASFPAPKTAAAPAPHFHPPPPRAHQKQCWQSPPPCTAPLPATPATLLRSPETRHAMRSPSPLHASSVPVGNIPTRSTLPAPKLPAPAPTSPPSETAVRIRDNAQSPPPPASAAT